MIFDSKIKERSFAFNAAKYMLFAEALLQSPLTLYYLLFGPGPMADLTPVHYLFLLLPIVGFFFLLVPCFPIFMLIAFLIALFSA